MDLLLKYLYIPQDLRGSRATFGPLITSPAFGMGSGIRRGRRGRGAFGASPAQALGRSGATVEKGDIKMSELIGEKVAIQDMSEQESKLLFMD